MNAIKNTVSNGLGYGYRNLNYCNNRVGTLMEYLTLFSYQKYIYVLIVCSQNVKSTVDQLKPLLYDSIE